MEVTLTRIAEDAPLLQGVKAVRALTGLGLLESKEIVQSLRHSRFPRTITTDATLATVIEELSNAHIGFRVPGDPLPVDSSRSIVEAALSAMPRHLTVADVLAVLRAVA